MHGLRSEDFGTIQEQSMDRSSPRLFLCAGLQCSGSTLVSWCFLQRPDMDGVLDGEYDLLPRIALDLGRPLAWCKTTISSFRLSELMSYYEDQGWAISPLLIVRDVRDTWASLRTKPYGVNGFTAEDPPLRLRFRRFKEDWELFQAKGWPILRYESLLANHEKTLRETCRRLGLPWDDSMLHWTKRASQIADASRGSKSFRQTQGQSVAETLARYSARREKKRTSVAAIWLGSKTSFKRSMQKTAIPFTLQLAPRQMSRLHHRFAIFRNCGGIDGSFSENRSVGCSTAWACLTTLWTPGS